MDVKDALARYDLQVGEASLYMLRHGGASLDFASKARDLEGIRRRGRRKSFQCLRRHEQGSRIAQVITAVPEKTKHFVQSCAEHVYDVVARQRSPRELLSSTASFSSSSGPPSQRRRRSSGMARRASGGRSRRARSMT